MVAHQMSKVGVPLSGILWSAPLCSSVVGCGKMWSAMFIKLNFIKPELVRLWVAGQTCKVGLPHKRIL